jgi:hypothetical protein
LNYAEAAVMSANGSNQEAYDILDAVRKRAGITAANNYGLGRKTGNALILDILNERNIELAFEGHRFFDVLRWRLYTDDLVPGAQTIAEGKKLNGLRRHSIHNWVREGNAVATDIPAMVTKLQTVLDAGGTEIPAGKAAFFDVFYQTVMLYDTDAMQFAEREYFLRIPYVAHIQKNPAIEQTQGWIDDRGAGKFNPYE